LTVLSSALLHEPKHKATPSFTFGIFTERSSENAVNLHAVN
jgi:hypothetical protein